VFTIIFNVPVIVDNIDAAGKEAKSNKARKQQSQTVERENAAGEKRRDKQEKVLGPILGP
jgi:hypothetical protein